MKKEIVQEGAAVLRETAQAVPEELFGTPELAGIIQDMKDALDPEAEGVALAAPQIGMSYRIFVVRKDRVDAANAPEGADLPRDEEPRYEVYINPAIVKTSRRRAPMDEGCLSVRGTYGTTSRHERATIRARNADGSTFERGGGGIMAQIFEHETDHLNGILFTDHAEHLIAVPHATTA
jgi:peptide deformylase